MDKAREIIRDAVILNITRSPTTKTNAILEALTAAGFRIVGPGEVDAETVAAKPLEWVAEHGVAGLGPYRFFRAKTPMGDFCYGTDSEGACWYHGVSNSISMAGDEPSAKRMAEAWWEKIALAEASKFLANPLQERET